MLVDLWLVYSFIRRLATPFNEWEAFKLGIIDERGNILKKRRELRTVKERDAFGVFDTLVLRLKRLLEKLPGGQTRIASYAAALWLIKEWNHFSSDSLLTEAVSDELILDSIDSFISHYSHYTRLVENVNQKSDLDEIFEERFSTHLNELFDKPYPYKLDANTWRPSADITLPDKTMLSVDFRPHAYVDDTWDISFKRGDSTDVTGAGDEFKVFSTVLAVIKDFIKIKKPVEITFGADKTGGKTSRSKLYDRMIKRFANTVGFQLSSSKEKWGAQYYTLTRIANEEVPVMNVGSGAIAGLGVGPDGEPGLTPRQMKRHRSRSTRKHLRDIIGTKL